MHQRGTVVIVLEDDFVYQLALYFLFNLDYFIVNLSDFMVNFIRIEDLLFLPLDLVQIRFNSLLQLFQVFLAGL